MRQQPKWTRRRFADRPSKRKKKDFDERNAEAAAIILSAPEQSPAFMIDWAQAFQRRIAATAREEGLTQTACGQTRRQPPANASERLGTGKRILICR